MSDEAGLLRAIWDQPQDDTPRLVYADLLDERGGEEDRARAELIRVQCELTRLAGDDPRFDQLEAREGELLTGWENGWWKGMPSGARKGIFSRGFPVPSLGRFSIDGLVRQREARLRAAPLWRYHYGVYGRDLKSLLPWPCLDRLELFALRPPVPRQWAAQLAECGNLRNVSELSLIDVKVPAAEMRMLLDAWAGRRLMDFRMNLNLDSLGILVNHPTAAGLRHLIVEESPLGPEAAAILSASKQLGALTHLALDNLRLGDTGVEDLLRWRQLGKLRQLYLDGNRLTNAGAEALAGCPALANLRVLDLSSNPIGLAGARALAASKHLTGLNRLSLLFTPASRSGKAVRVLRDRFGGE
jgi:uncharacterized protein (TIGR02996 family)